jgi:hypothetical protein
MTAVLVHELGHHQGELDHKKLDLLGTKVENMLLSKAQELRGGIFWKNISVTSLEYEKDRSFTQLIIHDGENYVDLSKEIADALTCDPLITTDKPVGARIWNLTWGGGVVLKKQFLRARVEQVCEKADGSLIRMHGYSMIEIDPGLMPTTTSVKISPQVQVREVVCPTNPAQCW